MSSSSSTAAKNSGNRTTATHGDEAQRQHSMAEQDSGAEWRTAKHYGGALWCSLTPWGFCLLVRIHMYHTYVHTYAYTYTCICMHTYIKMSPPLPLHHLTSLPLDIQRLTNLPLALHYLTSLPSTLHQLTSLSLALRHLTSLLLACLTN
jgi:hypothetical protein